MQLAMEFTLHSYKDYVDRHMIDSLSILSTWNKLIDKININATSLRENG